MYPLNDRCDDESPNWIENELIEYKSIQDDMNDSKKSIVDMENTIKLLKESLNNFVKEKRRLEISRQYQQNNMVFINRQINSASTNINNIRGDIAQIKALLEDDN